MTFPLTTGVPAATLALETAAVTALAASQTAITSAGVLQGASPTVIAPVVVAVQSASAAITSAIAASDADTATFAGSWSGTPPTDPAALVTQFEATISSVTNTSSLLTAQSYLSRAAINLALNTD